MTGHGPGREREACNGVASGCRCKPHFCKIALPQRSPAQGADSQWVARAAAPCCKTGRFTVRNGPHCSPERRVLPPRPASTGAQLSACPVFSRSRQPVRPAFLLSHGRCFLPLPEAYMAFFLLTLRSVVAVAPALWASFRASCPVGMGGRTPAARHNADYQ